MDMHFEWLLDREQQGQFKIYWRPGKIMNLADYFTKHHPPAHHRNVRDIFLMRIAEVQRLRQEQTITSIVDATIESPKHMELSHQHALVYRQTSASKANKGMEAVLTVGLMFPKCTARVYLHICYIQDTI